MMTEEKPHESPQDGRETRATLVAAVRKAYTDSPAAFSTPQRLLAELRRQKKGGSDLARLPSKAEVGRILASFSTYTLFRKKYKREKSRDRAVISGPSELFQMDLAFLPKYGRFIGVLLV
jgi:hypothetical protein